MLTLCWEFIQSLLCTYKWSSIMPLQSDYIALCLFHSRWQSIKRDLEKMSGFLTIILSLQYFSFTINSYFLEIGAKSSFMDSFIQSFTSKQAVKVENPLFLYFRMFVAYESLFPRCPFENRAHEGFRIKHCVFYELWQAANSTWHVPLVLLAFWFWHHWYCLSASSWI